MAPDTGRAEWTDYELLDAGEGRRLERFGRVVLDRPAATAEGWVRERSRWASADLRFDAGRWWGRGGPGAGAPLQGDAIAPWTVSIQGLTLELRATSSGGVGLYPEHGENLRWLEARIAERAAARAAARAAGPPAVLNLFAHTGLVSLAAARAGAAVTHLDAARSAVAWARRNAELSGLADAPIRWIVDDAAAFVAREARRGRRYDGIVLDPPSFGRAGRRQWRLADELPALLEGCRGVAADDAFVLLTAHTTGLDAGALGDALWTAWGGGVAEVVRLGLDATTGARLELGWAARLGGATGARP